MISEEKLRQIQEELQNFPEEEKERRMNELLQEMEPEEIEDLRKKQCPFCLIKEGKIDSRVVYNDDLIMGVLDINPANKGHIVLFPKDHYSSSFEMNDSLVSHIYVVANRLSKIALDAVNAEGVNIFVGEGVVAGQVVPHFLIHIIPRFRDDGIDLKWKSKKLNDEEILEVHEKIINGVRSFSETKEEIQERPEPEEVWYKDYNDERIP